MSALAQYDAIAEQYRRTRASPVRRYIEAYTLWRLLGDVRGLSVLDLGCGEGHYARQLAAAGAARVTGVDASPAMIELARASEAAEPLGIDYRCSSVQAMPELGHFDLVLGAYLLHYAEDVADLGLLCQRVAGHLAPGGRFVGLNENPDQSADGCAGYAQYGFSKRPARPRREGAAITYAMASGRGMIRFDVRWYSRDCYAQALAAAGFREVNWHQLLLDPAAAAVRPADYWREYLENPPVLALECRP
jgi:SAM-dependent methyltransferase